MSPRQSRGQVLITMSAVGFKWLLPHCFDLGDQTEELQIAYVHNIRIIVLL